MRIKINLYALGKVLKRINNLIEESEQRTQEARKKFLEAVEKLNKGDKENAKVGRGEEKK